MAAKKKKDVVEVIEPVEETPVAEPAAEKAIEPQALLGKDVERIKNLKSIMARRYGTTWNR